MSGLKQKIEQFERALKEALLNKDLEVRAAALDIVCLFATEETIQPICSEISQILWYNYNHGTQTQLDEIENLINLFYEEPNETCRYEHNDNSIIESRV